MAGHCFSKSELYTMRNEIDVRMLIRQTDFVHSVKFLQSLLQKNVVSPKPDAHQMISGSNPKGGCPPKHKPLSGKTDNGPCPIGKILGDVLPPNDGLPAKPIVALEKANEDRITKLEMQFEQLGCQIQKTDPDDYRRTSFQIILSYWRSFLTIYSSATFIEPSMRLLLAAG